MLWRLLEAGLDPIIVVYDKLIPLLFICGSVLFVSRKEMVGESGLLFKLAATLISIVVYAGAILGLTDSSYLLRSLVIENPYLAIGFVFSIALHLVTRRNRRSPY